MMLSRRNRVFEFVAHRIVSHIDTDDFISCIGNNKSLGAGIISTVEGVRMNRSAIVAWVCGTDGDTRFGFSIRFSERNRNCIVPRRRGDKSTIGLTPDSSTFTSIVDEQISRSDGRPAIANQTIPISHCLSGTTYVGRIGQ